MITTYHEGREAHKEHEDADQVVLRELRVLRALRDDSVGLLNANQEKR